jgi:hypothetical protein
MGRVGRSCARFGRLGRCVGMGPLYLYRSTIALYMQLHCRKALQDGMASCKSMHTTSSTCHTAIPPSALVTIMEGRDRELITISLMVSEAPLHSNGLGLWMRAGDFASRELVVDNPFWHHRPRLGWQRHYEPSKVASAPAANHRPPSNRSTAWQRHPPTLPTPTLPPTLQKHTRHASRATKTPQQWHRRLRAMPHLVKQCPLR